MPPINIDGKMHPWEEIFGPQPAIQIPVNSRSETSVDLAQNGFAALAQDAPAVADGGTTTLIPPRVVHAVGTMGVAYQGHHPSIGFGSNNRPSNGLAGRVTLNGNPGITGAFGPLRAARKIKIGFVVPLGQAGFKLNYEAKDDTVLANDLRGSQYGGTNKFNKVNIGLLIGHGVYGTSPDFTISASGPLETYYPVYKTGVNSYDWVRFTQFKFGSGSSSALRWMGIISCNNMIGSCYDDMYDKEALPIGNNLHLLLGCSSTIYIVSNFGWEYASALTGGNGVGRRTVADSWFFAGSVSQSHQVSTNKIPVFFRVAGWPNCFADDLINYQSPDSGNPGDITFDDRQVFQP